jgi:hypothetical protein
MLKNTPNQKWRVIAFRPDNTRVTGDAANITAKISINYAAPVALTDVTPTEIEDGYYWFDMTQAETNGDHIAIFPESTTADTYVLGDPPSVNPLSRYLQAY